MKKIVAILLIMLALCAIAGCTVQGVPQSDYDKVVTERDALQAELDELKATPEPEETAAATGIWTTKYYVDEFKQSTSKGYVSTEDSIVGTFNNSATTNSKLLVQFLVDKTDFAIALFEYGSKRVKNSSSRNSEEYKITLLTANGSKLDVKGSMYAGGDRIYIYNLDKDAVIKSMSEQGEVGFYIVLSDRTTTNYLFSVEAANFAEVYGDL